MPYYEKVREYSEIENRDIWEYQLNLEPEEVQRLRLHTWELLPVTFDYHFFDENCAYRILTLLDVTRPSLQLTQQFHTYAIPSDTLRMEVASGLVKQVRYCPSTATELRHKAEQLPEELHPVVLALAEPGFPLEGSSLEGSSPENQLTAMEIRQQRRLRFRPAYHDLLAPRQGIRTARKSSFSKPISPSGKPAQCGWSASPASTSPP